MDPRADTTLFGLDLELPDDKVGQSAQWSDDEEDDPIEVDAPLPSGGGGSAVAGSSSDSAGVYDAVSDRFVNPFESWTSSNVDGAAGRDIALPLQTSSFRFEKENQTVDMQTSIKKIIGSEYTVDQVDDLLKAFKESLPRTTPGWKDDGTKLGKAWFHIFNSVKARKKVALGAYSLTYSLGAKYYLDALNHELRIEYDELGRPFTSVRTALIMGSELNKINRYMVMRHRPLDQTSTTGPQVVLAEEMYRRFLADGAELSLSLPRRAGEVPGRVLLKRGEGFMQNAAAMARHVKTWLNAESNPREVYISIRYDVGQDRGEGGYDVVIPHVFVNEALLSINVPTSKRELTDGKEEGQAQGSKRPKPSKRGKKRKETGAVLINAPLASSRALMGAALSARTIEVDERAVAGEDPATSMFYNGLLGAKEPRVAEAMVVAASGRYDRLLYCTNTAVFPTEIDLGASAPPSWWSPPADASAYVDVPSLLYDPENTEGYEVTKALHSVAYVTVFDKEAIDRAREGMNREIETWVRDHQRYACLKDAFHYNPANGGKPAGIKEFALPSEVDSSGLPSGERGDLFVLPSLRPSRANAFDESRRFVHEQPPLRYAWSWVRDLITFGATPNGADLLTSAADSWDAGLDDLMKQEPIEAFLRFSTRLYTEYLQPDHHATMQVYIKALMHISNNASGGGVPILGFIENMSHVIALSLLHSIAMLGTYKARAARASDLIVEGVQVCMLSAGNDGMEGMDEVQDYIDYADLKRVSTGDERWSAAIDILRVDSDSVLSDASAFDDLRDRLIGHVMTFPFADVATATPDKWADPEWVALALKSALDTARSSVAKYRSSYPSTSPYVYDVLLKGDIVMFLSLCLKNGTQSGNVAGLFDGVEASNSKKTTAMTVGASGEKTLPSLSPEEQKKLTSRMKKGNNPVTQYDFYVGTIMTIPLKDLLSAVNTNSSDSEFAILVFWYVIAFYEFYMASATTKQVLRRETMLKPRDFGDPIHLFQLPKKAGQSPNGSYTVANGMRKLNEEIAQAKYVYDHLLRNRRGWFRTVNHNGQDMFVLDAVVAINAPEDGSGSAVAAPSSSEPPAAPAPAQTEEEQEQDGDEDERTMQMLQSNSAANDTSSAFSFDAPALASFVKAEIFPTGPSASAGSGGAGSSTDPPPPPPPSGKMNIDFNLKSLLSTHNIAYQIAVNAVFRTHVEGGTMSFATPKIEMDVRICAPSQKNGDYLMRANSLSSSGLEMNMRLLFDWMNEDLRRLKTSLSSRDVLDKNRGVDAEGNHIVVTAQIKQPLNPTKALIPEANVGEQFCPSTERNKNSNASTSDATNCDALRWAWLGKLATSGERVFPDKIKKGSYRFPTYLRFATSKNSNPMVACKTTTDVCNTVGDRLYFCGAELSRQELQTIYKDHPWDTPVPTGNTLRMSKEVQQRYEYMNKYVPVAEFAAYLEALNRTDEKNKFMKQLVAARGLASSDHAFVQALLSVFGWDKEAPDVADLSDMPAFGKSHTPPKVDDDAKCMIANINFLRFYELYTASKEGDTFIPYTFEDYVLHLYSVYCRIMTMSKTYTSQPSSYHTTTSLRGVVAEVKYQIAKLRQAFNALILGIATEQRASDDGTVDTLKTLEDRHLQNFTYIWKAGSLLHGVVGQRNYDEIFPVGSAVGAMGTKIKEQLELLGKDMAVVVGLEGELSYVEACGKALYKHAFADSSNKTAGDVQNCDPSKSTQEEVEYSTQLARSRNHAYWRHPMAIYSNRYPLSVNWRDRYNRAPLSVGQLMPQGATSDELHWASDKTSSNCNNDFGMHEAYASYLNGIFDQSTKIHLSEKLKERYGKPFSKWADSNSKEEFLCAPTDYSHRHTSNAAERLPTYTEILARHRVSETTAAASKLTPTFDDIKNEFMPSFETMRTEWFKTLMSSSITWNRALALRRRNGDVHPQASVSTPAGTSTVDPGEPLFVKRPTVHKEGVIDVAELKSRPVDMFSPDDEDDGGPRDRLDRFQLAIREALYSSSTSSNIMRILKANLPPVKDSSDALKLAEFVYTDYKHDFEVDY